MNAQHVVGRGALTVPRVWRARGLAAFLGLGGCSGPASALHPAGPGAEQILSLWWLLLGAAVLTYLLVLVTTLWAVRRRSSSLSATWPEFWPGAGMILGGLIFPVIVLTVLCAASVRVLTALVAPSPPAFVVEVRAHQWWWELRYLSLPDGEPLTTANELHLPVGHRVELRLLSADVIHSFWVPALQGKLDLVPGKTNTTWVQADRPGIYHGPCAEYCGLQHARMTLLVVAQPREEFEAWMRAERQAAAPATSEHGQRGQQLFLMHCAQCHVVRGTQAFFGQLGPDLTHVASRSMLAAGALSNVKGNLAGWIADPQTWKPGSRMPRIPLPPDDFHPLLDYVAGLR